MKFKKEEGLVFKTGRNILNGFNSLNDISNSITIKSIEGENERVDFATPLSISDVKKLFTLEIDTEILNPVYFKDKLGLEIKNQNFTELLTQSKEALESFNAILENMQSELIENTVILPENINGDNEVIKLAVGQLQEMISKKAEDVPVVGLISSLGDYKEKIEATIESSQKAINILKGDSLFEENILKVDEKMKSAIIQKKEELILKSQALLKDMTVLTESLQEVMNFIDKGQDFNKMFNQLDEVEATISQNR